MATLRKRAAELGLSAISIEGALIAPAEVARIMSATADQKTAADYGCPKGTTLKEEIARYFRIGQAHWQAFDRIELPTVQQVAEFARTQLEEAFGFQQLKGPVEHQKDGHRYRIAWEAKGGRVPIVCASPIANDDAFRRPHPDFGDGQNGPLARRTPTSLLQEWLNANPDFFWGLVFAGDRLRLMRDNLSFTRPAWIEADLGAVYRDENFSEFTGLWLLIHASRFGAEGGAPGDSPLERWREAGLRAGTAVRERLRGSVEESLELLGQGFLDANPELRERLANGQVAVSAWFEQLLRLVYRLIFLAVAEDRDLLQVPGAKPDAKALYADNYSFAWLRDRSARQSGRDRHQDAYEGTKIVFRSLVHGEPLLGLPSLGGLFAPGLTPDLDDAKLENRAFLGAVFRLAWLMGPHGRERINWRDMATEEFGSVYEGLLELVPLIEEGNRFAFAGGAEAKGNARKISGSYYTPDNLVQALIDSTLDPVLERAEAEGGAEAILDLNVIDPACGSGHFLLGAARRMANRVAQLRDPDAPDYQAAMREVVRRCIHGVDRNPLAVELGKVALWIEAIEPGRPLGFLDANIRCGDSLLGVFNLKALEEGIPDDSYKALTADDKATAKYYQAKNRAEKKGQGSFDWSGGGGSLPPERIAATLSDVLALPEDTVEQVAAKQKKFKAWRNDPRRQSTKVACDLYFSAFLLPKTGAPPANGSTGLIPTTADLRTKLGGGNVFGPREAAAVDAAAEARAFHWPIVFPDVMIGRGGFDVVLGNPPWEVVQLSEEEYFAVRAPQIARLKGAARKRAIAALEVENPDMFVEFQADKRRFEAINQFARESGRFELTARGKVNTYGLFAELFLNLTREGGRAGVIVPTGIITDYNSSWFFSHLVSSNRIASSFAFDNRHGIFPSVHRDTQFTLLSMGTPDSCPEFAAFIQFKEELDDGRRRYQLSPSEINAINPNTGTAPLVRTAADADLLSALHLRCPILNAENTDCDGQWTIEFRQGLFNKSVDDALLIPTHTLQRAGNERGLPSYRRGDGSTLLAVAEGSQGYIFDHRYASWDGDDYAPVNDEWKADASNEIDAEFAMSLADYGDRLSSKGMDDRGYWLAIRRVTNKANDRTLIAAIIPSGPATYGWLIAKQPNATESAWLCANLASLVCDFTMRTRLTQPSIPLETLYQLPVLPPHAYGEADGAFIVPRVLELSYTSWSMQPFARDLGYGGAPFAWEESRRAQLRAELDAWFALAYGLSRDELRYVLDPKEIMGPDYPSETFRVLQKNEVAKFGEYRTARLVLAAYDKMVAEGARPRTEGWR